MLLILKAVVEHNQAKTTQARRKQRSGKGTKVPKQLGMCRVQVPVCLMPNVGCLGNET